MSDKNEHSHAASKGGNLPSWIIPSLALFALWFVALSFLDIPVAKFMKTYKIPRLLDETLTLCNSLARLIPFLLLILTAILSLGAEKWRMLGRLLLAFLIEAGIVWGGKLSVSRVRPRWFAGDHWRDTFTGFFTGNNFKLQSFPSGDAALGLSVAIILAQYFPKHRYILYFLAIGCAASRVFDNYHFLSDALLGSIVGYVSARFVLYISSPSGK